MAPRGSFYYPYLWTKYTNASHELFALFTLFIAYLYKSLDDAPDTSRLQYLHPLRVFSEVYFSILSATLIYVTDLIK